MVIPRDGAESIGKEAADKVIKSISGECQWLGAQTLRLCDEFQGIARAIEYRHEGEASLAIKVASETVEKFGAAGVFTTDEAKGYLAQLNEVREDIAYERMQAAASKASRLADDVGWVMLDKLVECECKKK